MATRPSKVFRNFHKDIHRLYTRGSTTKPSDLAFSTFPQDSSSSEDISILNKDLVRGPVESKEIVEKRRKIPCSKQVFSSEEATQQIRSVFKHLKLRPYRCPQCRLIHVEGLPG
jgi:hypothetical protein